jgi:hypothetical protein
MALALTAMTWVWHWGQELKLQYLQQHAVPLLSLLPREPQADDGAGHITCAAESTSPGGSKALQDAPCSRVHQGGEAMLATGEGQGPVRVEVHRAARGWRCGNDEGAGCGRILQRAFGRWVTAS